MARYTGPVCRLCRRESMKLFLKGERCYTKKCAVEAKNVPPGQHGQSRKKVQEYGLQLREKQKARRYYGVLERQFSRYYEIARKTKGITGENLLTILETRLDNVIYRLGLATSRPEARQLVKHGHFQVNGSKVNIPSYRVAVGDVLTVDPRSRGSDKFKFIAEITGSKVIPKWLEYDAEAMKGRVAAMPQRDDVDIPLEEHLIVELYSK